MPSPEIKTGAGKSVALAATETRKPPPVEGRRRLRGLAGAFGQAVVTLALFIAAWEAFVRLFEIRRFLLPAPSVVAVEAIERAGALWSHGLVTLNETIVGFAAAVAVAMPLAVAVVEWPLLRRTVYPIVVVLQSVPKVAIAPILVVWIGFGPTPKVLVAALVCFFPIFLDTVAGLQSVPKEEQELLRSLRASTATMFLRLRFPHALPHIFVGLKVGITLAIVGAVVGEFVQSSEGLGYLILVSSVQANTPLAFAAMIVLAVMSVVLFYVVEVLEGLLIPWAEHNIERD